VPEPLLSIEGLRLGLATAASLVPLLHGVDLEIGQGEILGLVGESGSGKSLTCSAVMRLLGKRLQLEGSIRFEGRDLVALPVDEMVALRGSEIAMIVQEPQSAMNPVQTIGRQLVESLALGGRRTRRATLRERARQLLVEVGMPDAERRLRAFPHQLSGGQAQRALIAMMLARGPKLLLADEPTTALDVTVQAQILALLRRLRAERGTAILLVTHDLGVVAETCDRVAVMYGGRVVEAGPVAEIFRRPRHPYTLGLLGARPRIDRAVGRLTSIDGVVPDPRDMPAGCSFAPRCALAAGDCRATAPGWRRDGGHGVACLHPVRASAA
jgi:oligopeptide/dipeptide ABC transporter ATP-binding protein